MKKEQGGGTEVWESRYINVKNLLTVVHYIILDLNALIFTFSFQFCLSWKFYIHVFLIFIQVFDRAIKL